MGGMGRTIPGSYAEYTNVPASNVVPVDTELPWAELAAIPESYAIPLFNPMLQMPSGVHFSLFGSFMFGTPAYPLSQVPMQAIVDRVASGAYRARPARVFRFDRLRHLARRPHIHLQSSQLTQRGSQSGPLYPRQRGPNSLG